MVYSIKPLEMGLQLLQGRIGLQVAVTSAVYGTAVMQHDRNAQQL